MERAWIVALCVALCVGAGVVYLLRTPKLYRSTITVQVNPEQRDVTQPGERKSEEPGKEELLKTIEQNLLSPALVQNLIHQPELSSDPAFLPRIPRPAADERLRLALAGEISASLRRGTRLIDITAEDESPHVAQKIADLLVQEFLRSNAHNRRGIAQQAQGYLEREAERLKGKLASSETLLQEYKEAHRAVSLDARQNIVVERLKELNGKVTAAKGERLKLETDRAQIQALAGQPSEHLLALPSIASADEVVEFRRKITEKENEIVAMGYSPSHPRRVQVAAEVSELKIAIRGAIAKAAQRISTSLEAAQITETKLEEALRAQEELALELSKMAIPYESLAREVEADRAFYNSLLARMKEVQVGQGIAQDVVHVVAPALLPERPSKPRKALVLLLSGCAGVALGLTLALGSTLLDGTIRTVDQAEEVLGLRPLAAIPMGSRVALRRARMLLIDNVQSVMAETFRALRTAVQFAAPQEGLRTVLFTSSVPQEGKSFCAVNYAVALAQQGYRTLLIDADLRLPSLAKAFFGREQPAGLSDIFLGESDLDNSVSLTNVENLSILPAGQPVRHPAELVARASFTDLLANVLQRFDRVVIDSAPIHAVSETLIIAAQVQGVCLIVRAGKTRGAVVRRALQRLHEAGAHVPGFVLNGVPARSKGYFYHYQAPGYGRDEVYGASRAKRLRRAS